MPSETSCRHDVLSVKTRPHENAMLMIRGTTQRHDLREVLEKAWGPSKRPFTAETLIKQALKDRVSQFKLQMMFFNVHTKGLPQHLWSDFYSVDEMMQVCRLFGIYWPRAHASSALFLEQRTDVKTNETTLSSGPLLS